MAENKKKITFGNIGNALKSVATDHITAVAGDVFDEERQKYQNEVNTDLETTDEEIKAELKNETARAKAAEEAIIFDVSAHNDGSVFEYFKALLSYFLSNIIKLTSKAFQTSKFTSYISFVITKYPVFGVLLKFYHPTISTLYLGIIISFRIYCF